MGPSLEVVPFGNSKLLVVEKDGGLSLDGSIVGVEERHLFELEDYVSYEEEEEKVVGYLLVL